MNRKNEPDKKIDQLLEASGWIVQSRANLNLGSGPGIALRELPSPTGPADYWLFVNRQLVGAVVLALEISENLEAALQQFNSIYESLSTTK